MCGAVCGPCVPREELGPAAERCTRGRATSCRHDSHQPACDVRAVCGTDVCENPAPARAPLSDSRAVRWNLRAPLPIRPCCASGLVRVSAPPCVCPRYALGLTRVSAPSRPRCALGLMRMSAPTCTQVPRHAHGALTSTRAKAHARKSRGPSACSSAAPAARRGTRSRRLNFPLLDSSQLSPRGRTPLSFLRFASHYPRFDDGKPV